MRTSEECLGDDVSLPLIEGVPKVEAEDDGAGATTFERKLGLVHSSLDAALHTSAKLDDGEELVDDVGDRLERDESGELVEGLGEREGGHQCRSRV